MKIFIFSTQRAALCQFCSFHASYWLIAANRILYKHSDVNSNIEKIEKNPITQNNLFYLNQSSKRCFSVFKKQTWNCLDTGHEFLKPSLRCNQCLYCSLKGRRWVSTVRKNNGNFGRWQTQPSSGSLNKQSGKTVCIWKLFNIWNNSFELKKKQTPTGHSSLTVGLCCPLLLMLISTFRLCDDLKWMNERGWSFWLTLLKQL